MQPQEEKAGLMSAAITIIHLFAERVGFVFWPDSYAYMKYKGWKLRLYLAEEKHSNAIRVEAEKEFRTLYMESHVPHSPHNQGSSVNFINIESEIRRLMKKLERMKCILDRMDRGRSIPIRVVF